MRWLLFLVIFFAGVVLANQVRGLAPFIPQV